MQSEPHLSSGKIMHRELGPDPIELQTPGKVMHRELGPDPIELQPPVTNDQQPPSTQVSQTVQNTPDLRLEFAHSQSNLHHNESCLSQEHQQIPLSSHPLNDQQILQTHHIKIEQTPPHINDIPYHNSEDTLSGHELDPEIEDDHHDNEDTDEEEYISQLEQEQEFKFYSQVKTERDCCDDSNLECDNGEELDAENSEISENGKRKRYVCNKCQRIFNSCNALKYHNRTHSGLRPHQCEICNKSFFAIGALKAHTRTHTGDKPFECKHCDRKFRQWGDLKYHTISIHSTEKNHQCEFCGKAFSRKYSLVVHLRIHTSERNYKCEFCTKTFRASTYLQNHRKIHTGKITYSYKLFIIKF